MKLLVTYKYPDWLCFTAEYAWVYKDKVITKSLDCFMGEFSTFSKSGGFYRGLLIKETKPVNPDLESFTKRIKRTLFKKL